MTGASVSAICGTSGNRGTRRVIWTGNAVGFLKFSLSRLSYSQLYPRPDQTGGDNNGMQAVSDILEGIYRWADWPARTPALSTSLRDSGKSRADLWALAAMTAVEFGFATNNAACSGDQNLTLQFRYIRPSGWCGAHHSSRVCCSSESPCSQRAGEPDCAVRPERGFTFRAGRRDCELEPAGQDRPYWHDRHEVHPNPHGNGEITMEFFRSQFNLTSREVSRRFGIVTQWRGAAGGGADGRAQLRHHAYPDCHVPLRLDLLQHAALQQQILPQLGGPGLLVKMMKTIVNCIGLNCTPPPGISPPLAATGWGTARAGRPPPSGRSRLTGTVWEVGPYNTFASRYMLAQQVFFNSTTMCRRRARIARTPKTATTAGPPVATTSRQARPATRSGASPVLTGAQLYNAAQLCGLATGVGQ